MYVYDSQSFNHYNYKRHTLCSKLVSSFAGHTVVKKETFRPETGPGFPQYDQNPKLFGTNLFLLEWCKKDLPHFNRKKYFA